MSSDLRTTSDDARIARLPENHRTVLAVLDEAGSGTHLSAQDVWMRARARAPKLGFATVHRALARLHGENLIAKIDVPGASMAYYEPKSDAHAHFRCIVCGTVRDVPFSVAAAELRRLSAEQGVAIASIEVTFTGRCAAERCRSTRTTG